MQRLAVILRGFLCLVPISPWKQILEKVGEVGELSEIFQWRGEVKSGIPDWSDEDKVHLGQELSDVLIYLIRLAQKCHIDLPTAALDKIALNAHKYPAAVVKGSSKKYLEYDSYKDIEDKR
ncbi:dCTP pyrophosphatase 1-like isoform X2 [Lytechinus variegatus]|uniref:dCTP pyrophosphatase 1-like isoform X2 n=1 Tax=Lytechinus variegatus TaxID=7654 RepID=UPI001BB2653C|nr:dCTP pyrophosphatase 1-like isoform X2 [Lytechinus variegatus]